LKPEEDRKRVANWLHAFSFGSHPLNSPAAALHRSRISKSLVIPWTCRNCS